MTRSARLGHVDGRAWARFGALTASMFVVGTGAAAIVLYPDVNQDLAPSERLGPQAIGVLITQAAAAATMFCGVQSILAAAVLTWWRSRGHGAVSQYVVAALDAVAVASLTMLVIDRPWSDAPGAVRSPAWDWASGAAAASMALAVIYCLAQALASCTRAWRGHA